MIFTALRTEIIKINILLHFIVGYCCYFVCKFFCFLSLWPYHLHIMLIFFLNFHPFQTLVCIFFLITLVRTRSSIWNSNGNSGYTCSVLYWEITIHAYLMFLRVLQIKNCLSMFSFQWCVPKVKGRFAYSLGRKSIVSFKSEGQVHLLRMINYLYSLS